MRKLILAAVSVTALGLGGAGVTNAADLSRASQSSQNAVTPSASQILEAQQRLRDLGFYHGAVDGILDKKTKQAINLYQKENGLKETAILDQATTTSLLEHTGRTGSSAPPIISAPTWARSTPAPIISAAASWRLRRPQPALT